MQLRRWLLVVSFAVIVAALLSTACSGHVHGSAGTIQTCLPAKRDSVFVDGTKQSQVTFKCAAPRPYVVNQ